MAPPDDENFESLLDWDDSLNPLRVDVVGDFAGKGLFGIHGESLVSHCITQAKVDYAGSKTSRHHRSDLPWLTMAQMAFSFYTPSMQSRPSSADSRIADATSTFSGSTATKSLQSLTTSPTSIDTNTS